MNNENIQQTNSSMSNGMSGRTGTPVVPLPDFQEGGPVASENGNNDGSAGIPVIPLPDFEEGGPVFTGNEDGSAGIPVIPLPDPGEGGPVYPGPSQPSRPNRPNRPNWPIFPVYPLPNVPCFFCQEGNTNGYSKVRFLNAVNSYRSLVVIVSGLQVASGLSFGSLTNYGNVSDGFRTVTIAQPNGYVLLRKTVPFHAGDTITMAIIPSAGGIDLMQISDTPCNNRPYGYSCFRVANLAYYSNPLDVILYDGRVVYSDVRFKEVTSFKRIRPGEYDFYLAETSLRPTPRMEDIETLNTDTSSVMMRAEPLLSFYVNVRANAMYTVYILGYGTSPNELQTIIVEDRQ